MNTKINLKFTKNQLDTAEELYKQNLSINKISKEIGVYKEYLSKYFKSKGLQVNPRGRKLNLADIQYKINTSDFDYFIGILATDGSVCQNNIYLCFSEENKEILEHWNNFLLNKYIIRKKLHNNTEYYYTSFSNKDFATLLYSYGITPKKSFTLKLKYINWDVLRGVFDGDGSLVLDIRKGLFGKFNIVSASVDFINQIKTFLNNQNISCNIYLNKKDNCYKLTVGKLKDIIEVYNNMYKNATYFLDRKYVKFGPLVEKFTSKHSVNSGKEESNLQS